MLSAENRKCNVLKGTILPTIGIIVLFLSLGATINKPEVEDLNVAMFAAIDRIEQHSFDLGKHERIGEFVGVEVWHVNIDYDPYTIDMKRTTPEDGPRLFWQEGENDGDARVDPNGFPWIEMDLDPRGKTLNKKAHHNIFSLGLKHFSKIWRSMCYRNGKLRAEVKVIGEEIIDGKTTWVLSIDVPDYSTITVTLKDEESLFEISERYLVPVDKIVLMNPEVDDLFDISEGQEILVPNCYAMSGKVWIDRSTMFPVQQEVYDEKGLYERYVYSNLKVQAFR